MALQPWQMYMRLGTRRGVDPFSLNESLFYELRRYDLNTRYVADLLSKGACPDAVDADGWTALHVAAQTDKAQAIPLLVTAKNLNHLGSGPEAATPLMVAAAAGSTQAVAALLAAGADIRYCTPTCRSALGDALAGGHFAAALVLWQHAQGVPGCQKVVAAAVKAVNPSLNFPMFKTGATPLAHAAKLGFHQLFPLLMTPENLNRPLLKHYGQLTPLHLALKHNKSQAAEALLDAGAAVNIADQMGLVPLAYAVQHKQLQLHVRMLQLMKQQQEEAATATAAAAAEQVAPMEAAIAAAARLSSMEKHAHSGARLFAAVAAAWGPSAAADLLTGLLKRLGTKTHYLAETFLTAWRQAQREQLRTHYLLDRLQRLVLDPLAASRQQHQQQQQQQHQQQQEQGPMSTQDRALRLRLPLALLLNKPGQGPKGPQNRANADASLAAHMADLSLGPGSSQAEAIAAAAQRGNLREVAAALAAAPTPDLPAMLLVAAQAAGSRGHTYLCNVTLQQFAALDWQAATSSDNPAPLGPLVRAAVAASAPATTSTVAAFGQSVAAASSGNQQQPQQQPRQQPQGSASGTGFCLYRALLDSWAAVPHMVGRELAAQVVEAVEAATALAATAQAVEGA